MPNNTDTPSANGIAPESDEAPARDGLVGSPGAQPARGRDPTGPIKSAPPPSRYSIATEGDDVYLVCVGMPNLRLYVERGLSVAHGARKRYPKQTIFLDGAYADAPFLDHEARQYSLDHHAGCVRPFTLATCEQAAVMLMQGIPLDEGPWRVYINEPDLDAVLAAWILFNRIELLTDDRRLLHEIMPLVRVEGVIDAHGLDMGVLTALSTDQYEQERTRIDHLRGPELQHKAAGAWQTIDFREHTCQLLEQLDAMLYPEGYLDQLVSIQELSWMPLKERKLAVLCESTRGIYEVEAQLKQRFGKQLGLVVLDVGAGKFTLRQVDPFLPHNLCDVYKRLNKQDPKTHQSNGEDNLWGGSDEIGGSPRRTGSALSGSDILRELQRVYRDRGGWFKRLFRRR